MGETLNDPKLLKLAEELASRTGESVSEAVERALTQRLAGLTAPTGGAGDEQSFAERVERILAIGKRARARILDPVHSLDHGALLYDEHGLPK